MTEPAALPHDERYQLAFEESPQPMWLYDEETLRFLDVNRAAVAMYGYSREEFLAMAVGDLGLRDEAPALAEAMQNGQPSPPRIWKHRTKDGRFLDVEVRASRFVSEGRVVRLALSHDLSERTQLEAQVRQAQKIETVGQLAGGVAHDFNNLLTAIIGHADLLADYFSSDDPRAREVAAIRHAADLASHVTRQLLAFSRKQVLQPTVLDLNEVLGRMRRILRRLIGENIELTSYPGCALWRVKADPGQIEQIILNLAVNARDAMPAGGRLTIKTINEPLDRESARRRAVDPGDYVALVVSDSGIGIAPAIRARLFEPFFTTKEHGHGTGLGLATVYSIVRQYGGTITVDSDVGHGATFSVYLRATSEPLPSKAARERGIPAASRGSETVLLVEDDQAVRSLIGDVLRRRGYRLFDAEDGARALEIVERLDGPLHLLITDVIMTGMSGVAVADAVCAQRPSTKVLYVSGYNPDAITHLGLPAATAAFLRKPFTPDTLARKVRAVLEAGAVETVDSLEPSLGPLS